MSSLKGRKVQTWINTPLGRLDKAIAHIIYRTFYEQGLRGKALDDAVFANDLSVFAADQRAYEQEQRELARYDDSMGRERRTSQLILVH